MKAKRPPSRKTARPGPVGQGCFTQAGLYAGVAATRWGSLREAGEEWTDYPWSERHLQCVWFDPAYRPEALTTSAGEAVAVLEPGVWNREAGPDFMNATLQVGGENGRVLKGDVEVHVRPADWRHHGHSTDPRYQNVVAHVTYFPGVLPPGILPRDTISIALREGLARNRGFAFDLIDVSSYPWPVRAIRPPCADHFAGMTPDELGGFLDSAGERRMQLKAERMLATAGERDREQMLYEEVLSALGYKHNRMVFRQLARRVPVQTLRQYAKGDAVRAYALLAGMSGLLPDRPSSDWDDETRTFIRKVWDIWWKLQGQWGAHALSRKDWRLAGVRPVNHPLRRLMAAAQLASDRTSLSARLISFVDPEHDRFLDRLTRAFSELPPDSYWCRRLGLAGTRRDSPVALIGVERAAALVMNVAIPFLAAGGHLGPSHQSLLRALPPEHDNTLIRTTARLLLGRDHNPALYRTALRQQGLIQIFQDFCLHDRTRCQSCALPAALANEEHGLTQTDTD
jgi:hypothetical protein